jgi:hypothetical protein
LFAVPIFLKVLFVMYNYLFMHYDNQIPMFTL